ncbi:hypothetical protein BC829DRAFT_449383 [Chytridium lagenaria]|nr:hypothetical protein BC829DRAFT_449383 [Chytridium lagenaria]
MTPAERYPRRLIALGLVIALTVIWTFFVAAVTLLEDLRAVFKGNDAVLKFLNQNSQITVILQGFLAPIILAIALALLPMILKYISWFQGISSSHGIMKSVLYKLFFFQVYQVFMSTVFKALQATLSSNTGNTGAVTDIYRKTVTDALVQIGNPRPLS